MHRKQCSKWTNWVIPRTGNKSISLPWRIISRFMSCNWKWSKWKFHHLVKSARSICCRSFHLQHFGHAMHNRYWRWTQLPCVHLYTQSTQPQLFSYLILFSKSVWNQWEWELEREATQSERDEWTNEANFQNAFIGRRCLADTRTVSICWRNGNPLAYGCYEFNVIKSLWIAK